jgi:hypothetical protein
LQLAQQAKEQEEAQAKQLQSLLDRKKSQLPAEPDTNAPDVVCLGFQLRDGTRLTRRFELSNTIQVRITSNMVSRIELY